MSDSALIQEITDLRKKIAADARALSAAKAALEKWRDSVHETEYDGRMISFTGCCDLEISSEVVKHDKECPAVRALLIIKSEMGDGR